MSRNRGRALAGLFAASISLALADLRAAGAAPIPPGAPPALAPSAAAEIAALEAWKAARSADDEKVDSSLLFARDRAAGRLPASLARVEALAPRGDGRIEVDLEIAPGTAARDALALLGALGAKTEAVAPSGRGIRAWVPLARVGELARLGAVRRVRPARLALAETVVSEGDRTHQADTARNLYGLAGRGRKVCVLSDGVDSLAISQNAGELPAVDVVPGEEGQGDEGTAMLEIAHDLAPDAALGFATAFSGVASFADNIETLADRGCDVIVDDVIYLVESPFEDGPIAAAADDVAGRGVVYLSAAGNEGNLDDGTSGTWQGDFHANGTLPPVGSELVHDFGDGGQSVLVTATAPAVTLHWTDPFGASGNDYDLYVLNGDLTEVLRFSNNTQDGSGDPFEIVSLFGVGAHPGDRIVVARVPASENRLLNLEAFLGHLALATEGATRGHSAAAGALAIAAAPASVPYQQGQPSGPYPEPFDGAQLSETFTADGPRRIFFAPDGTLLPGAPPGDFSSTGGVVRAKPDLTAADGVVTSVEGFERFFGTSAAAPHAAAIAALLREAFPGFAPSDLAAALRASAIDIETPGPDRDTGAGIAAPLAALEQLGAPLRATIDLAGVAASEFRGNGNGDGTFDPGELWAFTPTATNVGGATATGVVARLTTSTPGAHVRAGEVPIGDLAPGASSAPTAPLVLELDSSVPCGAKIELEVEFDFGGGVSPAIFDLTRFAGSPGAQATFAYSGPPVPIPDATTQGEPGPEAVAPVEVADFAGRLVDLDFSFDGAVCTTQVPSDTVGIQHPFVADLVFELESPAGTRVTVVRRADGFGNNFCQTYLDDESAGPSIQTVQTPDNPFTGSYKPASSLARFDGEDPDGTWILHATDWNPVDTGVIRAFSIHPTGAVCHVFDRPEFVDVPALSPSGAAAAALLAAVAGLVALARRRRAPAARVTPPR